MARRAHHSSQATSPRTLLPPLSPPHTDRVQIESLSIDDARCEIIQPATKLQASPRRAKAYPRLQTLEQLAERRVELMHDGDFVARSQSRWQSFHVASSGFQGQEPDPNKAQAYLIVRQSSALVIQSCWRRFAASQLRRRLATAMWKRQQDAATWVTARAEPFRASLDLLTSRTTPLSSAILSLRNMYGPGLFYQLPAALLSWIFRFNSARSSSRFLRRSPAILRAIDMPVSRSLRLSALVWRSLSTTAATIIQKEVRSFLARRLMSRLRMDKRRCVATIRIQSFFRMMLALRLVKRYRHYQAARKIQSCWRCKQARTKVTKRRAVQCTLSFVSKFLSQSVVQVAALIRHQAATKIQKSYRGSRARVCFRQLASESQQQSWTRNPSKGLALFARKRYSEAALQLEECRRQGGFQDIDTLVKAIQTNPGRPASSVPTSQSSGSGSRMSFSLSAAPTTLGADWTLGIVRTNDWTEEGEVTSQVARYLEFWNAYALSHWFTFEATGEQFNLRQAWIGFEMYQQVDKAVTIDSRDGDNQSMLSLLRFHCSYRLAKCLFLSDNSTDHDRALSLSLKTTNNYEQLLYHHPVTVNWRAELWMLSSMIHLQRDEIQRSYQLMTELLELKDQTHYSELELRFTSVLLLLRQLNSTTAGESDPEGIMERITLLLHRCYQIVELWPGVGFYHGEMSSPEAKTVLSHTPEGSFLLHHSPSTDATTRPLLLQVKLPDKVASLVLELDSDGLYRARKLRNRDGHWSVHSVVKELPASAGIVFDLGVRKSIVKPDLRCRLRCVDPDGLGDREASRRVLLDWDEWERVLIDAKQSNPEHSRRFRNETWSSLCLQVAKYLESSQAWSYSLLAARESIQTSSHRRRRAAAYFLLARVSSQLSHRKDVDLYVQHTRIEAGIRHSSHLQVLGRLSFGIQTLTAVEFGGGFFPNISKSSREAFETRLDRVSKLERMCLKAWRFDSLATSLRGDPFSESLLLQRVQYEVYADCGDTFFLRSLLRAHVRAYLTNGRWYEDLHLELAFDCVVKLANSFHNDQRDRIQYKSHVKAQLSRMIEHTSNSMRGTMTGSRQFSLDLLLLSWHHLPFSLCFEVAEVLYRLSAYRHHSIGLVDVYESLYGRLRGSKPRTPAYSAYEELVLLRLAFLHASNLQSIDNSLQHLTKAVECMDEIIQLRRERAAILKPSQSKWMKKISWPTATRVPIDLSDAEILFIRGFLLETGENLIQTPSIKRQSWRNYRPLHDQLIQIVAKTQASGASDYRSSLEYRSERLKGLRVHIGATRHVQLKNVLHSRPFVSIWCEGGATTSQTQPTWADLSPSWDEYVELDVKSPNARVVVSLVDHQGRFSIVEPSVIGTTTVYMQQLLESDSGVTDGQFITLLPPNATGYCSEYTQPQLFLSFQVILKSQSTGSTTTKKTGRVWRNSGNWQVDDLRTNLHGDLRTLASTPWVWRHFAELFSRNHEFSIATWFFHKATALTTTIPYSLEDVDAVGPVVRALTGLAVCQRATMCNSDWNSSGRLHVEQAASLLKIQETWDRFDQSNPEHIAGNMDKELATIRSLLDLTTGGPLEQALSLNIPASSQWIKVPKTSTIATSRRTPKTPALYYLNQDTGECSLLTPLEYEEEETIANHNDMSMSWISRGVILMNATIKHRVSTCRRQLETNYALDPLKWIAILNTRRQEMQFFSQADPFAKCSGSRRQVQPATYSMQVNDHVVYHVLVIQDAFRLYQRRKQRRRLVRGIVRCACWLARELLSCRRRLFMRSEAARKAMLNCLYVYVERGQGLKVGDWITSDPYVELTVCGSDGQVAAKGTTSVRRNTRNPKWNEEFYLPYEFSQHEQGYSESKKEARLTLLVLDHDMIQASYSDIQKNLLGKSVIAIDAFQHGKRMTADLDLLDPEDFDDEGSDGDSEFKTKTRGLLTVSIQWIHYEEDGWCSTDGRHSIVKPRRTALDIKPTLPDSILTKVQTLRNDLQSAVKVVLDLTMSTLDPLVQLHKKMRAAQAKGRTAEEAKVHEHRLAAVVSTQLAPQYQGVQQQLESVSSALPELLEALRLPVMTYIDEAFEPEEGEAMRGKATTLLTPSSHVPSTWETTTTLVTSLMAPGHSEAPQSAITSQPRHQEALELIAIELKEWINYLVDHTQRLTDLMTQFFVVGRDTWPDTVTLESLSSLSHQLNTLVDQLATKGATLAVNVLESSPRRTKDKSLDEKEKVKAATTLANRKERIEREKRRRGRPQR